MLKVQEKVSFPYGGLIPKIVSDYLERDAFLTSQVNDWFDPNSFDRIIDSRNFPTSQRQILVQTVKEKYAQLNLITHAKARQQIESLSHQDTFTITTGHQLSLFGGTLFMAFKILTAIKLARELKERYPLKNFVPILWLASEDHDFEEIKSTWWQEQYLTWNCESEEKPTGNLLLETLQPVIEELIQSLEKMGGISANLVKSLRSAYSSNSNLGDASFSYYHSMFADEGLLVLDANESSLKAVLKPIIHKDLFSEDIYTSQMISDRRLSERYKLQIKARNGNFFYLHEQFGRRMLKKQKKGFKLAETDLSFSVSEIQELIEKHPERFSPNVNLRPVYQELVLPNLAYIGGPAEIAYWLQLKPIFDDNKIPFPILTLRFMGAMIPNGIEGKLMKYGLSVKDVLGSEKELKQRYFNKIHPFDYSLATENILIQYQSILTSIVNKDAVLAKEFLSMKLAAKKALKGHQSKYRKAVEKGEDEALARLCKIRAGLYPNGVLQERIETYLSLQLKVGLNLNQELLNLIDPFAPGFNFIKS